MLEERLWTRPVEHMINGHGVAGLLVGFEAAEGCLLA